MVQGALTVAEYEAKFSVLRRYAPHIFHNPCRKLKKIMDDLRSNIHRYDTTNDPKTFTKALRIAHFAERENDRFMVEQKSAGKRPMPTLAYQQKGKQICKVGPARASIPPQTLTTCATYGHQHPSKECWKCSGKCFNCGELGHKATECKKPQGKPEARKIVYQGWVFALTDEEASETPTVMTGTLLIDNCYAKVLFDSGATHSFISSNFAKSLQNRHLENFEGELLVRTPIGVDARISYKIPMIEINLTRKKLPTEVYVLNVKDFDVILGMDWLETHYVLLDCRRKRIIFQKRREKKFTFQYPQDKSKKFLISALKADQLIMKGCAAFLASVVLDGNVGKSI